MNLLNGLRVLDLCDGKGTFCSKLFADLGADVIKIERPGGDQSRMTGPFLGDISHPERSLSFFYSNTNKCGITLNLETDKGVEIFLRLARTTDVIIESFQPGYLETLGLDYISLKKVNPAIILTSITGFGQTGPRKDYKSCDIVASAFSGQMYVTGSPHLPPVKVYGEQSYFTASLFAAAGILLALRKRTKSGDGDHIDVSLQESALSCMDHVMIRYYQDNIISGRLGNRHWDNLFFILRCSDGFIHMTPFRDWDTLIELLDDAGMAGDLTEEKWTDEGYRIRHADRVIDVLGEWTVTFSVNELFDLARIMHFPWAPVSSPAQVMDSPQLKVREFFMDFKDQASQMTGIFPGLPFKFRNNLPGQYKSAPLIGEDNDRIYIEELGYTKEEITEFSSQGII